MIPTSLLATHPPALDGALARASATALKKGASHTSVVLPWTESNPLSLFRAASALGLRRMFWEAPEQGMTVLGIDTAVMLPGPVTAPSAWHALAQDIHVDRGDAPGSADIGPLLLGGAAFDPFTPRSSAWAPFGSGSLFLPRVLIAHTPRGAWLVCTVAATSNRHEAMEQTGALLDSLMHATPSAAPLGNSPIVTIGGTPTDTHRDLVARTTAAIRQGHLQKVVLARHSVVARADGLVLDPTSTLTALRHIHRHGYIFALGVGQQTFVGATPEQLAHLARGQVSVAALAGTTGRGDSAATDAAAADWLLADAKNQHEHALVVSTIASTLASLGVTLDPLGQPTVLRTPTAQHLYTPIRGQAADTLAVTDLVAALHPTPAVCGLPGPEAISVIRSGEQFDRGWYAGPIGWMDLQGAGEFAVALRCGLLDGPTATLYAGGGIMANSEPTAEELETQTKLRPMREALQEATWH